MAYRNKKALREQLLRKKQKDDSQYEGGLNEEALKLLDEKFDKLKKSKE